MSRKAPILTRPAHADEDLIRVRLDHRTIILLKSMDKFAFWKERYPQAEVIDPGHHGPAKGKG
jgi:hypothetical protein